MNFRETVKGKKVLVFGLGLQGGGLGDAVWLAKHGAEVRVTDQKPPEELQSSLAHLPETVGIYVGGHREEDVDWAEIIIKNPGVPDTHPLLIRAAGQGKPVLTSIAVCVQEMREKVVGITGTRGKSTTTELTYRVLERAFPGRAVKGGNIPGTSGLGLIDLMEAKEYAVLELSSFQLHNFHSLKISPRIAIITNIYPDHLNRYGTMDEYQEDKRAIAAYQQKSDTVIANRENEGALSLARSSSGRLVMFSSIDVPADWNLKIPGKHNRENIAAVLAVAEALGIKKELVKNVVEDFHGLAFRLENRGEKNGIRYINDTTSTTPTAAIHAIRAMDTPTVIIMGGETKNLPIDEMIQEVAATEKIEKVVILGSIRNTEFTAALERTASEKIAGSAQSMDEAVRIAEAVSSPGWTILLSPGFASFDLFANEFDRGRAFNDAIGVV